MKGKTLVIGIYSHPEYYPPTLNALEYLAGIYEHVYVVHRNITGFDWKYPANVTLLFAGEAVPVREAEAMSLRIKLKLFSKFTRLLKKTIRKHRPHTILMYDSMALLGLRLVYPFISKPKCLWYHNHDVSEPQYLRKYSLAWMAWKSENWALPKLNLFSLPATERREYFSMDLFKGDFWFLPNFPSKKIYSSLVVAGRNSSDSFRLLYQGSIGPEHGLEEIIPLLSVPVHGKTLQLVLKGFISDEYLEELKSLATQHGVAAQLIYLPPGGYRGVIENAFTCHAGIGIHKKQDAMNKTLGTASNKIYEYAAAGMPALVYDNAHFRKTLDKRNWIAFTDTEKTSLQSVLRHIVENGEEMGRQARNDFEKGLCFEDYFLPLVRHLQSIN